MPSVRVDIPTLMIWCFCSTLALGWCINPSWASRSMAFRMSWTLSTCRSHVLLGLSPPYQLTDTTSVGIPFKRRTHRLTTRNNGLGWFPHENEWMPWRRVFSVPSRFSLSCSGELPRASRAPDSILYRLVMLRNGGGVWYAFDRVILQATGWSRRHRR